MIRIAYFSNQFASSSGHGIARYSKKLFETLRDENGSIVLLPVSASTNTDMEQLQKMKATTGLQKTPLGRIFTPLLWIFLNRPYLESMMNAKVDVVHAVSLGYKIATTKPYVVTIHDIGPLTNPKFFTKKDRWFMKGSLRQAVMNASAIICVSQTTADEVENYSVLNFGKSVEDRLHVIHEGVDDIFFKYPELTEIRDLSIAASIMEKPFVLTVGKISPRKNLKIVLEAFHKLKDSHPHLNLIAVGGNGWEYDKIKDQLSSLGIESKVHFLGYVSDNLLRLLYRKAKVFVYPSLFEGFGLTILEAMASQCPVITSDISCLPEIAGDSAILIDPYDSYELASKITLVINDEEIRSHLVRKGLERAEHFTWNKTAEQTKKVYNSISL